MPNITIAEQSFEVPVPYQAGPMELTAGEAHALNQAVYMAVRNKLSKKVTRGEVTAVNVVDAVAEFTFDGRARGGKQPIDPVEKEAIRAAREAVIDALKIKGSRNPVKDYGAEAISERAKRAVAADPKWLKQAKVTVSKLRELADASLVDGLEVLPPPAEPEQPYKIAV